MMDGAEVPPGWVCATVGDIVASDGIFTDGDWVETKDQDPDGDVRLIQLADIGDGNFLDKSSRFLTSAKAHELNCTFLEKGDLLIARMPEPLGRCCIFPLDRVKKYVTVVDVCAVRLGKSPTIAKYVMYAINSPRMRTAIEELKSGSTRKRISRRNLARVEIPLAPQNEQRRIVAKIEELFSELDKSIESLKAARAKLNVYRQAVLKHAFEGKLTAQWREENKDKFETPEQLLARIKQERATRYERELKEWEAAVKAWEAEGKLGKKPSKPRKPITPDKPRPDQLDRMWKVPPTWQWLQVGNFAFVTKLAGFEYTKFVEYDDDGDLPVIKAENAGLNGFRATRYSRVKSESVKHLTRSYLEGSELLMVFVGAGTGNVATVPRDQAYFLGPNIGMIRPETQSIKPRYVEFFLRSPMGKQLALASVKAVTQPSLSMGTIRQIPVILPSTEEQSEIVQQLDNTLSAIDAIEAEIDNQLLKAASLRQSILKNAFSGQLVPQDPHDEPASILLERIKAEKAAQSQNNTRAKRRRTTATA